MSLEKKDVHVRLEESIHSRLSVLADWITTVLQNMRRISWKK